MQSLQGAGGGSVAFAAPEIYMRRQYGEPADFYSNALLSFNLYVSPIFAEGSAADETDFWG